MGTSLARAIVIMGVSGCGKSHIGKLLSKLTGSEFIDGDDCHPQSNIEKMASGTPLTDQDRWPWLQIVKDQILANQKQKTPVIIACSALKQTYRDFLRAEAAPLDFVYLKGSFDLLASRLQQRAGHFFPTKLLEDQLETLEEPKNAIIVDIAPPPASVAEEILTLLNQQ